MTSTLPFKPLREGKITPADIVEMGNRSQQFLEGIRRELLAPYPRKAPPTFKTSQVAELAGVDRKRLDYLLNIPDHELPQGEKHSNGRYRLFSLVDAINIIDKVAKRPTRPSGVLGKVISCAIFKGGVAKTTTAVSMAQAMTLKGMKVLLIDMDAQGSATQLMGYAPDAEIGIENTVLPVFYDTADESYRASLVPSIQKTYWHNLDLIGACSQLFEAEMCITSHIRSKPNFEFWNILRTPLEELSQIYDCIVIDTPPQLSYTTLNAIFASNGILAPVPPQALDFASSTEFWWLLGEVMSTLDKRTPKQFDFVNVVLTRVKSHPLTPLIIQWISEAYRGAVLPIQIPDSRAIDNASAQFCTIYDTPTPDGTVESYRRVRAPMDQLADYLYSQVTAHWR